jgi:nicotinamide-nucleotide amidase
MSEHSAPSDDPSHDPCETIADILDERDDALAVAESLTGGLLADRFASSEGASEWFRGGVVAYQKQVKFDVLDVPEGPVVTEEAAVAMARGVRALMDATITVGVTGAGGPDPQDGQPPGTVWIAVVGEDGPRTREHHFDGDPPEVIEQAHAAAVDLLLAVLQGRA